jgi:hypothetical protein
MSSQNLENLVKLGQLKREAADRREFDGLVRSAHVRLDDARNNQLSIESRFDLAYNAAHALALAALRWHGYRSDKRYTVFQCVPHTLGLGPEVWRVLALCHDRRNLAEYEGHLEIDAQLVADLLLAADRLIVKIETLEPLN